MPDPLIIRGLKRKRAAVQTTIATYEKRLKEARRDLAHVAATLHLFESPEGPGDVKLYHDIHRLFRRNELGNLCKQALSERGPLDTRELSHYVMEAKGFEDDNELRKAIAYRIVNALRQQWKRGRIQRLAKRKGVIVWWLD